LINGILIFHFSLSIYNHSLSWSHTQTLSVFYQSKVAKDGRGSNPPTLSSSSGVGSVLEIGGFKSYVSGPSSSKLAILLVSDVYGYEAPNLRKLADKVAAAGYYVVVPEFLYGDPYNPENTEKPLSIWIQSHGTDKGFEDAKKVVAALKDKGISAIGAAGFCWGAKVVTDLAKSCYIQAAVQLHPSLVKVDDIKEVKASIAILAAEIDRISPPELIKQFEEILSSKPEGSEASLESPRHEESGFFLFCPTLVLPLSL
ncbi:endo-1,3;1,4-beta-D-glucanase-like, partial [Nicotiana sylvestris]|uniref:Endo-1,31,4-beta-D-glucanase-like n=1 Tax=Nicotiana sylvestris TaxID=4096 RepID=A0A1U7YD24_NICSY